MMLHQSVSASRVASSTGDAAPASSLSVSVEALAWIAAVATAAGLRLIGLGHAPFTVAEASRGLDAALVSRGGAPEGWTGDLAGAVTSYLFRIFGESEAVARLLPALAGVALVAAVWTARPYIGRTAALIAASLVAVSPLFVIVSRSALPFSTGSLLVMIMATSLFAYLRAPRPGPLFAFVAAAALAPLTDAAAVSGGLAVLAYLALEGGVLGNRDTGRAWAVFRSSPLQLGSSLLVMAAALELGLTHFGTSLDKTGLAGLRQWVEMFETQRDGRAPEYYAALLTAYDWPLLAAGAAGSVTLSVRVARGGAGAVTPFQRWLLVWTVAAALTLALTTRREPGQLVILLLPLALVAGSLLEELLAAVEWNVLRRWWPLAAAALVLAAYAALTMTAWSSGQTTPAERAMMVIAAGGAVLLVAMPFAHLGRNAAALPLTVAGVLATVFLAHSTLAVTGGGDAEFAMEARLTERAGFFRETVDQLAAERGGFVRVDRDLRDVLGWTLRDSPVVFGGPSGEATTVIARANDGPEGFTPIGGVWLVAEGWYPEALLRPRRMWRWLLYRQPYYGRETVVVRIYVPAI